MKKKEALTFNIFSQYKSELYGLTILWIMIFHSYLVGVNFFNNSPTPWNYIHTFISHGNMGCDMFLFLSGIFCFYSFSKKPSYLTYEKKRYIRLLIPVLLINGLFWFYQFIKVPDIMLFIRRITLIDFWETGDQQIWFVSLILVCYLLYPVIFHIIFTKDQHLRIIPFILTFIFSIIGTFILEDFDPTHYTMWEIGLNRIPVFILGCSFGVLCKNKVKLPLIIIPICFIIILGSLYVFHEFHLPTHFMRLFYICGIAYVTFDAYLLHLLQCKPLNAVLRFFGDMSLPLYLTHILFKNLYEASPFYTKGNAPKYFLVLAISTLAAWVAFRLEKLITSALFKS